jgi:hypothetical protein
MFTRFIFAGFAGFGAAAVPFGFDFDFDPKSPFSLSSMRTAPFAP